MSIGMFRPRNKFVILDQILVLEIDKEIPGGLKPSFGQFIGLIQSPF
jgi:hypothetical protein